MLHQLNESKDHCDETHEHICPEEGHHHCSLCDVVIYPDFFTTICDTSAPILWQTESVFKLENNLYSKNTQSTQDRAPPIV